MTKTKYYDLQMDDPQDDYDVDVVNANLKKIDEQMKTRKMQQMHYRSRSLQ